MDVAGVSVDGLLTKKHYFSSRAPQLSDDNLAALNDYYFFRFSSKDFFMLFLVELAQTHCGCLQALIKSHTIQSHIKAMPF